MKRVIAATVGVGIAVVGIVLTHGGQPGIDRGSGRPGRPRATA